MKSFIQIFRSDFHFSFMLSLPNKTCWGFKSLLCDLQNDHIIGSNVFFINKQSKWFWPFKGFLCYHTMKPEMNRKLQNESRIVFSNFESQISYFPKGVDDDWQDLQQTWAKDSENPTFNVLHTVIWHVFGGQELIGIDRNLYKLKKKIRRSSSNSFLRIGRGMPFLSCGFLRWRECVFFIWCTGEFGISANIPVERTCL